MPIWSFHVSLLTFHLIKTMNILITGATKGIGNAIAKELADTGRIFVTGRNIDVLKTFENYCICDLSGDLTELQNFITQNKIDKRRLSFVKCVPG